MFLELIILTLVVFSVFLVSYKGAVHEFQILQKDWSPNIEWGPLLGEQLPLVIRNVSPDWQGVWTRKASERKTWPVQILGEEGQQLRTTWREWLASGPGEPMFVNGEEIAAAVKLSLREWTDGGFCRATWLSQPSRTEVGVLGPRNDSVRAAKKTTAITTLVQATDGAPLSIWLAHDGAVPAEVAKELRGKNPWQLKSEEIPWIDEVKFIEIKLRPGNALAIPAHWWWAARTQLPVVADKPRMADGAWFWIAEFQTPVSWVVSKVAKK